MDSQSDFAFEMEVLSELNALGFVCVHGGSYTDPVTQKVREFDIRASRDFEMRMVHLAVECKNLEPHCPLLISCVPRREEEAFYELALSVDPDVCSLSQTESPIPAMRRRSLPVRLSDGNSLYRRREMVGKSCDQVGVREHDGEFMSGDADIYSKWSQALSSAHELTYEACAAGETGTKDWCLSIVIPLLVVPDDTLWSVEYDSQGKRTARPRQVSRCSYYINRSYFHKSVAGGDEVTISHLEFVTATGLREFVENLTTSEERLDQIFPIEYVMDVVRRDSSA